MRSSVVITGATGFVGRALVARIRTELSWQLVVANRRATNAYAEDSLTSEFVVGDIDGRTDWRLPLKGAEVVIHLAARVHVMEKASEDSLAEFRRVNVQATENLARVAAGSGVRRLIYVSSIGVNGAQTALDSPFSEIDRPNPQNPYALSKWEAEQSLLRVAAETKLEVVIVRPPLVYGAGAPGNFAQLMRVLSMGIPLPLGSVNNRRSLVGLDNLTDFIVTCMSHPQAANQTFLISDGEDISTPDLIRGLGRAMNRPVRLFPMPVPLLRLGATLIGRSEMCKQLCGNLQINSAKARTVLGWVPPFTLNGGLLKVVEAGLSP